MKDATPQTIYLADYQAPAFWVDTVQLDFHLDPHATRVISRIAFRPNPDRAGAEFTLDGEDLKLIWAKVDGLAVTPTLTDVGLTCTVPDAPFLWEAEVEIDPAGNTALEGLYISNGMYCTQCEAEGFRRITYYPDRPDVMATFDVTIHSDLPVLLSNGNSMGHDIGVGTANWFDPWPKPAYLFALVAGDLQAHSDQFTTRDGRNVALNVYVRPADIGKCAFAMEALKSAMQWDEDVYDRVYDLDIFNIVAVDDFNSGAMENKGLNIFNSSCVLVSPETATDGDYMTVESIVAHEYFHNWTGNRITCRDWFQLCLKEGLTVFRDQQFTSDLRGADVKRIDDAFVMRAHQFQEDAGPLSHPVRPDSFVEINNFYTATVYEKGAEVIGMLKTLIGDDAYYRGCALYFDRHDGQACTIEDWLACFADVTGRDLTQFARWYSQSGTPRLKVQDSFADGTYTLTVTQSTPASADQPQKHPQVIPLSYGLLDGNGRSILPTTLFVLNDAQHTITHSGLDGRPVASLNRNFAAPVIIEQDRSSADLALLLAHDPDPFNRWDAGKALATQTLTAMVRDDATPDAALLDGLLAVIRDEDLSPAFRTCVMNLPTQDDIAIALAESGTIPDPAAIYDATESLTLHIAQHLQDVLPRLYAAHQVAGPYQPDADSTGHRSLANMALKFLSYLDGGRAAQAQFDAADNMTQQRAALASLLMIGKADAAVDAFAAQWQHDRLVMDKWFSLQVMLADPADAVATAQRLSDHPDFDIKNPNRFRAVFGALSRNTAGFHQASGAGYDCLSDWLIKLDAINPSVAARGSTAFETWRRYDADRQDKIRAALNKMAETPGLSRDTSEMVTRMLDSPPAQP